MRRDLITAFLIVASATAAVAIVPEFVKGGPAKIKHEEDTTIKIDLPPPPPVEPPPDEEVQQLQDASKTMAPPSLVDVPTNVPLDSIAVRPEPPPPPSLKVGGTISVPVQHTSFNGAQIFNLADLDTPPEPRLQPSPQYPFEMRRAGIEGAVNVGFICDTQGHVVNPSVLSSSGHPELDQAAIQAISRWSFRPGKKGGQVVNVRMSELMTFSLENN
ncbi:MAG TPA: energy transducer TonB [Opitutaceae bacterium]|nr:energy transducer TonB [Opitutaceae bacterium]